VRWIIVLWPNSCRCRALSSGGRVVIRILIHMKAMVETERVSEKGVVNRSAWQCETGVAAC